MAIGDGIGRRIKSAREAKRLSASALAQISGVTQTAVWNWETNEISPRHETLIKVAKALGVTEDFLRLGKDGPDQNLRDKEVPPLSVSEILEEARAKIAEITGFELPRVKIHLEFLAG